MQLTAPDHRFRLDGRAAVITGASSGLGVGFAVALADAGANVVLGARRVERLVGVCRQINDMGGNAHAVQTDVTDPADYHTLARTAVERFGSLDVLVNNAGMGTAGPAVREVPDDFRAVVDVNLMGAIRTAQACARLMRRGSSIVNISSVLGLIKSYSPQAAYAASKAGLIGLTRDLSQQWAGRKGIRVNAIAPGYFESELTAELARDLDGVHQLDGLTPATGPTGGARRRRPLPLGSCLVLHHGGHPGRRVDGAVTDDLLDRSSRAVHTVTYIVDETRQRLACTIESVSVFVSKETRWSVDMTRALADGLDAAFRDDAALPRTSSRCTNLWR